ncbi:MAG TPA: hypothetical protein VM529_10405 [Gemmata sp.]|nr:hypothetical protein [Gemmata sp.]
MNRPPDRARYVPSGAIAPFPFLALALLAGGAAVLAGYVVHLTSPLTFPGVVLAPLIAGLPVAGVVAIAVRVGRCRNPALGGLLGLLAGGAVLPAAFQFALAAEKGNDHVLRVDRLPEYVQDHVHDSDRWDRRPGGAARAAGPGELGFRWGVLALGCLTGCVAPAAAGWATGAKPYSEAHGRWHKAWPIRLTRRSGAAVAEAVAVASPDALRSAIEVIPPGAKFDQSAGFAHLVVDYLPGEPDEPVYASLAVMTVEKGSPPWPRTVFKRWQLTPEEAAALAAVVAVPNAAFGAARAGALPGDRVATAIGAKVVPLPDQDAGLILSRRNQWLATAAGFLPLALGVASGAAAGVAAARLWDDLGPVELAAVIAAGAVALAGSLAWMVLVPDYLPARVFHARARRVVADRPDPFVHPDDPGAFFVQMIPRKNWGRVMLENAEELGFMRLDEARGVILFEGDRERWMIPREGVVSCELDAFDIGPSDASVGPAFWLVVLRANVDGRVWEAPLSLRPVTLQKATPSANRRKAERLREDILRVLGRDDD